MNRSAFRILLAAAVLLFSPVSPAQAEAEENAAETPAKPPADSPLAKVHDGMDEGQVASLLGNPHMQNSWRTGKGRIPFYHGSDRRRQLWQYKGIGTVTFSKGRHTSFQVIEVAYNPDQLAGVEVQSAPIYVDGSPRVVVVPHVRRPPGVHAPGPRVRPRIRPRGPRLPRPW